MPHLRFPTLPPHLLETVLSDIAAAFLDRPVDLGHFPERAFDDDERVRTVAAPGVTATETGTRTWEPGRDGGWGYSMHWRVEAGNAIAEFGATGWEPVPNGLGLRLEGIDPVAFRRIRECLRLRLGADTDQTDDPWPALDNIAWALEVEDLELARELLEAARTHPDADPDGPWHTRLAALQARLAATGGEQGPPG